MTPLARRLRQLIRWPVHPARQRGPALLVLAVLLTPGAATPAPPADVTTIVLKASVPAAPEYRLADVAELAGAESTRLAGVVIAGGTADEIAVPAVRAALDRAGVNWGRVTLRGQACAIVRPPPSAPARPAPKPDRVPASEPAPLPRTAPGVATVRALVLERLAELYRVPVADMRATLRDGRLALLDTPAGRRVVEIAPEAGASSTRVPLAVRLYEGDRLVASDSVVAEVLLRRAVVVVTEPVARGARVPAENLRVEDRWVAPGAATPASAVEAAGATARDRIEPGAVITAAMLDGPVLIGRGDTVMVHCISGPMVVKRKAKAIAAGREGDMIDLRPEGSRRTIRARVSARGVAVLNLDAGAAPTPPTEDHP